MTTSTGTTPHADGEWAYWFCPDPYKVAYVVTARHKDTQFKVPATDGMTVPQMLEAIWTANVATSLGDPKLLPLTQAAVDHLSGRLPPVPKWAVAKNGTTTTRPVYLRNENGTLGALVKDARATVGAECTCSADGGRVVSGSSTYCAFGPEDPVRVTLCKPAP
jgi:hypothetical protein